MDMIIEILATEAIWNEANPQPQPSVEIAQYNDGADKIAYLYNTATGADDWPPSALVLGAWNEDDGLQFGQYFDTDGETVLGTVVFPIQANYEAYIRPLGNDNGIATGNLDSHRWQGHSEAKFMMENIRYPATNMPFTLKITREDHTSDPTWPGWGWRVDMMSDDPLRDITARGIGIYSDPDWNNYLYTTGAFVDDGSGNYFTECPIGQRTAVPDPVYFALLLGAAKEGTWTLIANSSEAQFWSADQ